MNNVIRWNRPTVTDRCSDHRSK